ncbi:MAG: RidA family protein, partial [Alphaproteobacteria bacterium]|nr:RidA family protein [Alphaproteobacteria bacterium]
MTTIVSKRGGSGAVEARLAEAHIALPAPQPAIGNYRPARIVDGWLFTSGQLSWRDGAIGHPGLLGRDVSVEQGREAAAIAALKLLAQVKAACAGDLDKISHCVRLSCFVACTADFLHHATIVDPVSSHLIAAFGDEVGVHARLA